MLSAKRLMQRDLLQANSDYLAYCQSQLLRALEDPTMLDADIMRHRRTFLESVDSMAAMLRRDMAVVPVVLLMPPPPPSSSSE